MAALRYNRGPGGAKVSHLRSKIGVVNVKVGVAVKISRALCARSIIHNPPL